MKPVIIEEEAERELIAAADFYERERAGLGAEFESAARGTVRVIQTDPERHPLQKRGVRRCVMQRFPFVIHYMDLPDVVWIIAFAHTSRKPNYWMPRLQP